MFYDPADYYDRAAVKAYHDALPQWLRRRMQMRATTARVPTESKLSPRLIRACWRQKTAPNPGQNPRQSAPNPRLRACVFRRIRAATPELCLWDKIRANPRRIRANPARNPRTAFSAPEV